MGETIRPGTRIRDFWPDDTDTKIYKDASWSHSLATLVEVIKAKWPDADLADIHVSAEHIHTHALGYGRYDAADHTNFIVIEYTPSFKEGKPHQGAGNG
jgi:hypothetical protein